MGGMFLLCSALVRCRITLTMDMIAEFTTSFFGVAPWGLLVVFMLVFLAGYVDAIAGGGGLISLPAYLIAGVPTHAAIATNKLSSSMGTAVATFHYAKSGFINLRLALPSIAFAFLGSFLGSNLLLLVDDWFLRVFLLIVLPVTAIYVMKSKSFDATGLESFSLKKTMLLCMAIAFAVGLYDGFYGPGTGTFLMLLLTGIAHLRLDSAAGVTKSINLTTNIAALAVFLFNGQVAVLLGLVAGVFNMLGNYLGSHSFTKNGGSVARPITITVLLVFFVKIVWDMVA